MNNSLSTLTCIEGTIFGFGAFVQNDAQSLTIGIQTVEGNTLTVYFQHFTEQIKKYARIGDQVIIHANPISPKFFQGLIFEFQSYKLKHQKGSLNEKMLECHRKVTLMQTLYLKLLAQFRVQGDHEAADYYLERRLQIGQELPALANMAKIVQQVTVTV